MQKQLSLNLSFLKLMNESDFPFFKSIKVKKLKYFKEELSVNIRDTQTFFSVLEFSQLIKSIKQYARLIKFLSLKQNKQIYLGSEFKNFFLFKLFLARLYLSNDVTLQVEKSKSVSFLKTKSNNYDHHKLFVLFNLFFKNNKNNLDKIASNNLFLICEINSELKIKNNSFYKIFNELSDFKKGMFLILILEKYLKI